MKMSSDRKVLRKICKWQLQGQRQSVDGAGMDTPGHKLEEGRGSLPPT